MKKQGAAVVVFSGGQDSTTCLGWALRRYDPVHAITFYYQQKHDVEVDAARYIIDELNVPFHHVVNLSFLPDLVTSALTSGGDVSAAHPDNADLPASFVPNRNALFLTLAHAYAEKVGAGTLVAGMCETDYSGYPDCREFFVDKLEATLNMGSDAAITIETPLMHLDKGFTFALAEEVGVLPIVLKASHTCYNGVRAQRHAWGLGCGECPACKLRARGWEDYQRMKREGHGAG